MPPETEIARVEPVLRGLADPRATHPRFQFSIDTRCAQVMRAALAAALHALDQGKRLLRVHDVTETRQVVEFWRGLGGSEPCIPA